MEDEKNHNLMTWHHLSIMFIEGCEYGDKSSYCHSIEKGDCYNSTVRVQCCDTCDGERNTNLPGKVADSCVCVCGGGGGGEVTPYIWCSTDVRPK